MTYAAVKPVGLLTMAADTGPPSSFCANEGAASAAIARATRIRFMQAAIARGIPLLRLLSRPFFRGSRRPRDRADHRPVVPMHDHRLLRLRPQIDGDVVVAVAQHPRLDRQIAHALAEPVLPANRRPLDDDPRRLPHPLEHADFSAH